MLASRPPPPPFSSAIVSTEEHPSTMNLALSVEEDETVTFSLNGMETESRYVDFY